MREFVRDMTIGKMSPATITARVELLNRLRRYLTDHDTELLVATPDQLRDFQATFAHLAPASVDIYSRHMKALYQWAHGRDMIPTDPSASLITPRIPRGRPHPMTIEELEIIFATTRGVLRVVFALAAFAGLRRGEICRLQRRDMDLTGPLPTALIHGKGGHERIVPLLRPLMDELEAYGLPRSGYVVTRNGKPYPPEALSVDCHYHLKSIGLETTLHSARHAFATHAAHMTRDPLFVRDILGHSSVATTEIYMDTSMSDAHMRLAQMSTMASELLSRGGEQDKPLRAVEGGG